MCASLSFGETHEQCTTHMDLCWASFPCRRHHEFAQIMSRLVRRILLYTSIEKSTLAITSNIRAKQMETKSYDGQNLNRKIASSNVYWCVIKSYIFDYCGAQKTKTKSRTTKLSLCMCKCWACLTSTIIVLLSKLIASFHCSGRALVACLEHRGIFGQPCIRWESWKRICDFH